VANDCHAERLLLQLDSSNERPAEQTEAMLLAYERASPAQRAAMRATGKPCDRQRWLNGYAYGKANEGLRIRVERSLELGLLALCVHDFACDFRDDYFALAHLFYAADRIGADRVALARRIGPLASREGAQHILAFAQRPDGDRALSAWMLHEFQTPEGPEVRCVPPGWTPDQPWAPRDGAVGMIERILRTFGKK
jgi:hypothetical protein